MDTSKAESRPRFPAGVGDRPLVFPRMLADAARDYLLPAYPAVRLLAAWMMEAIADEEVTLRRWPLGRLGLGLLGSDRHCGHGCPPGRDDRFTLSSAASTPRSGFCGQHGNHDRDALAASRAHQASCYGPRCDMGSVRAGRRRLAHPRGRAVPHFPKGGREACGAVGPDRRRTVLLNYQEPGVIYAMQKNVATVRNLSDFDSLLDEKAALLTVIKPEEAPDLRDRLGLDVNLLDDIDCFSLTKGQSHALAVRHPAAF